jgi:glycosyltransferase involved in cell wall biosynthesis
MRKIRLAISVSHPIQHFVPFYRALAAHPKIDLRVIYRSSMGLKPYFDTQMQAEIAWKMDMTGGYDHVFLEDDRAAGVPVTQTMSQALKSFAPDAAIVYGYAQPTNLKALGWCRLRNVPVLMIGDSELLHARAAWKLVARKLLLKQILAQYAAYLAVGDQNENFYRTFGAKPDRIFRVPFSIDEGLYREAAANREALRSEVRAELSIGDDAFVALFVGKLADFKRPGDVLDAVRKVASKPAGRRVHALFAGNGELLSELKAEAEEYGIAATFAGFVNVDKLPAIYAAADILIQPSSVDAHPLVCSEAACIGLPMLLSDRIGAAGPTDIARPGENAEIFPVGDVDRIATLIGELANDPVRYAAMAARSRAIFDECDIATSVDGVVAALERVGVRN